MKIGFLIKRINYSGSSKIFAWLANAFAANGDEVLVVTFSPEQDVYTLNNSIKRFNIKETGKNVIARISYYTKQIKKIITDEQCDVLVSFLPTESAYAVLSNNKQTKIVVSERSDPIDENGFYPKICRSLMNWADGGVFQSKEAMESFSSKLQKKSVVIQNPIFPSSLVLPLPLNRREKTILFVGRIENRQKRVFDFVEAAFVLISKYNLTNYTFLIAGDGPDFQTLKDKIASSQFSRFFKILGPIKDTAELIKKATCVTIPSRFEGIPNVMLESMSVGTPLVISNYSPGGVEQYITSGKDGYVLPKKWNPSLLASIIFALLSKPEVWELFSHNSFNKIQKFSPNLIFKQWDNYLHAIIKK